jgi:hypothetical protein
MVAAGVIVCATTTAAPTAKMGRSGPDSVAADAPPGVIATGPAHTVNISMSPQEAAAWKQQISTPAGQAEVVRELNQAFEGYATFGIGTDAATVNGNGVQLASFGITSTHFWFIVSDHDMIQGAGWGIRAACVRLLPIAGWLICGSIVQAVTGYVYGDYRNHGVWGEVYWWWPHIRFGTW